MNKLRVVNRERLDYQPLRVAVQGVERTVYLPWNMANSANRR